jgi:hypothetical protein
VVALGRLPSHPSIEARLPGSEFQPGTVKAPLGFGPKWMTYGYRAERRAQRLSQFGQQEL